MQVMRASKQEDIRKQSIILTKKMLFKADCFKCLRKRKGYENESTKRLRINNGTHWMPKFQTHPWLEIYLTCLQKVKNPKSLYIEINHKMFCFQMCYDQTNSGAFVSEQNSSERIV